MELKYKTRGQSVPRGKQRVYFTCHAEDFAYYFADIAEEILQYQDCAIYYDEDLTRTPEENELSLALGEMQLFVIPVTAKFLHTDNRARLVDFQFAIDHHIPILPLMQEPNLDADFNEICGNLQYLSKLILDETAIPYKTKLQNFLSTVLIGDEIVSKVKKEFDAYIFLSYRKKDRHYAKELMRLIHENEFCRDIAIWYDEFLSPGENFNEAIAAALQKSALFTLVVTPNLINEPNYIMDIEYPMARELGKEILPTEMQETDERILGDKYADIPSIVKKEDGKGLSDALSKVFFKQIEKIANKENDGDLSHLFFIGLAYLNGIDVEVNRERGVALIKNAADQGLLAAMEKMRELYLTGNAVKASFHKVIDWQSKIVSRLQKDLESDQDKLLPYMKALDQLGDDYKRVGKLSEAYEAYYTATKAGSDNLSVILSSDEGIHLFITGCLTSGKAAYLVKETDTALQLYDYAKRVVEVLKENVGGMEAAFDRYLDLMHIDILKAFAEIYQREANLEKADMYIGEALQLCRDSLTLEKLTPAEKTTVAYLYVSSAEIAFDQNRYTQSEQDYKTAISLFDAIYRESGLSAFLNIISSLYHRLSLVAHYLPDMELKKFYENKASEIKNQASKSYSESSVAAKKRLADELYEKQEYEKAYALYRELADLGDVRVLRSLAFMFRMGYGVEKSVSNAIALYEKAAASGDGVAAGLLGMMYRDGSDTEKDEQKALSLFKQAMELGDANGRLLYQTLKSKLDYEASKKKVKRFVLTPEALPPSDQYKTIAEIVVGQEKAVMLLDTENHGVYLLRGDGLVFDKFSVWAPGWADFTSFDWYVEDGHLVLVEADFCHYNRYTEIIVNKYEDITKEEIVCEMSHEDDAPGRKVLSIPATALLRN